MLSLCLFDCQDFSTFSFNLPWQFEFYFDAVLRNMRQHVDELVLQFVFSFDLIGQFYGA
jgi:hypothetical protein